MSWWIWYQKVCAGHEMTLNVKSHILKIGQCGTKLWYKVIDHFYVFFGNWPFGPTALKLVSILTCILIFKKPPPPPMAIDNNWYLKKWSSLTTYKPKKLNHKSLLWIYNITIETVQACMGNCLNNLKWRIIMKIN